MDTLHSVGYSCQELLKQRLGSLFTSLGRFSPWLCVSPAGLIPVRAAWGGSCALLTLGPQMQNTILSTQKTLKKHLTHE